MHPLERVPAVRRLATDKMDVFAVEIAGEMSPADVENLRGLLEGAYQLNGRLDLVLRLSAFEGLEEALPPTDTLGVLHEEAVRHVRRIALVGDDGAEATLRTLLNPRPPVETARFPAEREEEAWAWIGAREIVEQV